jgi:pre-mRNA-splicing factor CWC22
LRQYDTIHRLEINKLRNVARLFAHLLYTDSIPWTCVDGCPSLWGWGRAVTDAVLACSVLDHIHLNEDETTSSSRIFIKILFQELAEHMGVPKLSARLQDPMLADAFRGLLPVDNPKHTRFAINFFTSVGLGGLTCVVVVVLVSPRFPFLTSDAARVCAST